MADVGDVSDSRGIDMDKREMKKHILFHALDQYDKFQSKGQIAYQVQMIMDRDEVTEAMQKRFVLILREMRESAVEKLQ